MNQGPEIVKIATPGGHRKNDGDFTLVLIRPGAPQAPKCCILNDLDVFARFRRTCVDLSLLFVAFGRFGIPK